MLLAYIVLSLLSSVSGFPGYIPIGALLDTDDEMIERAFNLSIKAVNKNVLVPEEVTDVFLSSRSLAIDTDPFEVANSACELLSMRVAGIFGPQNKATGIYVESMCDNMDIPHIVARWDPEPKRGNAINLYPHWDTLTRVYEELIEELNWKSYGILYDTTESLIRVNRLLELKNVKDYSVELYNLGAGPNFSVDNTFLQVGIYPTPFGACSNNGQQKVSCCCFGVGIALELTIRLKRRKVLQEVKNSGFVNLVIDCSYNALAQVLEQAMQVGIMSEKHSIIVTSLDLHTLDLEPYQYSGVNITGVRLIDPENPVVRDILGARSLNWNLTESSHLRVEPALTYDAVQLFAVGYARLRDSVEGNLKRLFCNGTETWEHGHSLSNFMRTEQIEGLTGRIKFDNNGYRSDFHLDVITLGDDGLNKIGTWSSDAGIHWYPKIQLPGIIDERSLRDNHFIVLISLTEPYGMLRESAAMMTGNDRYEGFAVDIIQEMSKMLGFNYTFEVQNDYGSYQKTSGTWSGMIGKIMNDEAHLAITDLTITSQRETAVDFTTPFMNLGISVLYRKPTSAPPGMLSFLLPFSKTVWLCLLGAYAFVSVVLLLIGRLCPVEWTNPYPCIKEPENLENPFTVRDAPYFTIAVILGGSTDFAPAGISTRTLATFWWFFFLIMNNTYIANLAAALSTKSVVWPFTEADDLAFQTEIKYGAKKGGSTLTFFQTATYPPYKAMYRYMKSNAHEVLTSSNEAGLYKVQQENYAFFMESASIEYFKQRNCNVTQVNGLLDAKGYGIAMKKNGPFRTELSGAILKLKENGMINELQDKWWKQKRGGDKCQETESVKVAALNFEDTYGIFVILVVGVILSFICTCIEFLWGVRSSAIENNVSFGTEFVDQVKFLATGSCTKIIKRR